MTTPTLDEAIKALARAVCLPSGYYVADLGALMRLAGAVIDAYDVQPKPARKVVQLHTAADGSDMMLCDDGTVWSWSTNRRQWERFPLPPGCEVCGDTDSADLAELLDCFEVRPNGVVTFETSKWDRLIAVVRRREGGG